MANIIGIDPGTSGGIAWTDNKYYHAVKMPDTPQDIFNLIMQISLKDNPRCFIEKVGGYVSGNSATAAVKFARHCGHLEAFLIAGEVATVAVSPSVWMRKVVGLVKGEEKLDRKNRIKDAMQRRFPDLKVTLATADALGILVYGEGVLR